MKAAMWNSLTVGDVMSRDVLTLEPNLPVERAWEHLRTRGVSGAPVVDAGGRVRGVFSLSDLADPRHHDPDAVVTVDAVMTRVVYAVRPSDPVWVAVQLMRREHIHRVVVVEPEARLAGIVVPMDLLRVLEMPAEEEVAFVDLRSFQRTG